MGIPGFLYLEPRSPHIVIDRNDPATLHIKDIRREDEGTYKIEFVLDSDRTAVAEQRVNVTVLGKLSSVHQFVDVRVTMFSLRNTSHFLPKR